ncbi:MAG: hypothetical protein Q4C70_09695 [Planctomycetia bacterium]|nr:hypothetical protein [Planctomycetia bacterium]
MSYPSENLRKIGNAVWCMPIVAGMIGVSAYCVPMLDLMPHDKWFTFWSWVHFVWMLITLVFGLAVAERFTRWPERVLPGVRNSGNFVFWYSLPIALAYLGFCEYGDWIFRQDGYPSLILTICLIVWFLAFLIFSASVARRFASRRLTLTIYGIVTAVLSLYASGILASVFDEILLFDFVDWVALYFCIPLFFGSIFFLFLFLGLDLRKRGRAGFPKLENLPMSESSQFTPRERWGLEAVRVGIFILISTLIAIFVMGMYLFFENGEMYSKTLSICLWSLLILIFGASCCLCAVPKTISENRLGVGTVLFQVLSAVLFFFVPILGGVLLVASLILLDAHVYRISCAFRTEGKNPWTPVLYSGAAILFLLVPSCVMYALSLPPYFLMTMKMGVVLLIVLGFIFIVSLIRALNDISGNIQDELEKYGTK